MNKVDYENLDDLSIEELMELYSNEEEDNLNECDLDELICIDLIKKS